MLNNEGLADYIENLLNILKTEYDGSNVDIWVSFKNLGYCKQDGNYVFYDKAKYHYVVQERGVVYQNDETFEESELAYWLLKHKIRHYASAFVKKVGVSDEEY